MALLNPVEDLAERVGALEGRIEDLERSSPSAALRLELQRLRSELTAQMEELRKAIKGRR